MWPPAAHPDRVAGNRPGGEVRPGLRRVVQLEPLPRPCPSAVLVRSGACTRTGPFAPTASRGEPTVAVGAPSCGGPRPHRQVRGRSWQPLETQTKKRGPHTGVVVSLVLRCSGGGGGGAVLTCDLTSVFVHTRQYDAPNYGSQCFCGPKKSLPGELVQPCPALMASFSPSAAVPEHNRLLHD